MCCGGVADTAAENGGGGLRKVRELIQVRASDGEASAVWSMQTRRPNRGADLRLT